MLAAAAGSDVTQADKGLSQFVLSLTFPLRGTARVWISAGCELTGGGKSVMYCPHSEERGEMFASLPV